MRIFKEEQRFTQLWSIVLMVMSTILPLAMILKDVNSMSSKEIWITIPLIILTPALFFLFKLTTRIDDKGIHYKFFPFHWKFKTIIWSDIEKAYVRKYDALTEYGGWGLKGGFLWKKSKGIAINVSGEIGIQIEFKNGKKTLIGTKKEEDAKSVLKTYLTSKNEN